LTFLKFCESDFQAAESFADVALAADRASASALVNKGNCRAVSDDLMQARVLYSEACSSNPTCLEALYNLGLVCKKLGDTSAAISTFEKLRGLCSQGERTALDLDVLWQLADLHLGSGDTGKAKELLLILASGPRETDAGVLAKLAEIFNQEGDELQAYHFYAESLKFWPKNLQVLGWLGVYYVRHELFEFAIPLFLRGAELQTEDKKWLMLVASCYRRSGSNQNALAVYEQVAERYPDDVECLRYLVTLAREMSSPKLELYAGRLARAERLLTGELGDLEFPTAPARPSESRKPNAAPDPSDERWSELPDIGI
jgi:intraflagellar transport protein 88